MARKTLGTTLFFLVSNRLRSFVLSPNTFTCRIATFHLSCLLSTFRVRTWFSLTPAYTILTSLKHNLCLHRPFRYVFSIHLERMAQMCAIVVGEINPPAFLVFWSYFSCKNYELSSTILDLVSIAIIECRWSTFGLNNLSNIYSHYRCSCDANSCSISE